MTRYEAATLALWAIAILAAVFLLRGTDRFAYLAPVLAMCLVGSVLVVRKARGASPTVNSR